MARGYSNICRQCWVKELSEKTGEKNHNWKGGKTLHAGYVRVRDSETGKYIFEHILVWEQENGPVPTGFQVHHRNGIKTDNRIENLEAMSASDHHRFKHDVVYDLQEENERLKSQIRDLLATGSRE